MSHRTVPTGAPHTSAPTPISMPRSTQAVTVPDLGLDANDRTVSDCEQILSDYGWAHEYTVVRKLEEGADVSKELALSQHPLPDTQIEPGQPIHLVIGTLGGGGAVVHPVCIVIGIWAIVATAGAWWYKKLYEGCMRNA